MSYGLTHGEKFMQKAPPHIRCYSKEGFVHQRENGIDYDLIVLAIFLFCIVATVAYFAVPVPHKAHAEVKYMPDAEQEGLYCKQAITGIREVREATYDQIVGHCKKYLAK